MAGLLKPTPQQNPEQGAGQQANPEQQAKPEQQTAYDSYVGNGFKLIHGEKTRDSIINMLKTGKPVDAVANATLMVLQRLDDSSQENGVAIPDEVRLQGGNELMGEIIAIGEASGAFQKPLDDVEKEAAFRITVGKYMKAGIESGRYTKEEVMEAAQRAKEQNPGFEEELNRFGQMNQTQPATAGV